MPENEQRFYDQVIRRITWIILALGLAGSVVLAAIKGVKFGFGFLIGSAISYLSFWRWQQVVGALGPGQKKRPAWMFILRVLALVVLAVVIIRFLKLDVVAAVSGLLVSAAAVVIEIIYELVYAAT